MLRRMASHDDRDPSDAGLDPQAREDDVEEAAEDDGPAPTPFDHPLFLPALLFAFSLWFGYDGFLNDSAEMQEHLTFNRWGFGLFAVLTVWFGYKGLREMREEGGEHPGDDAPGG